MRHSKRFESTLTKLASKEANATFGPSLQFSPHHLLRRLVVSIVSIVSVVSSSSSCRAHVLQLNVGTRCVKIIWKYIRKTATKFIWNTRKFQWQQQLSSQRETHTERERVRERENKRSQVRKLQHKNNNKYPAPHTWPPLWIWWKLANTPMVSTKSWSPYQLTISLSPYIYL